MAVKNYKVNDPIMAYHQALGCTPGIVVQMDVYTPSLSKDVSQSGQMFEVGASTGRYEKVFTPNVAGDWSCFMSDAVGGKTALHFSVGNSNIDSVGIAVTGVANQLTALSSQVTLLQSPAMAV
jgi:hypothetical protein